MNIMIGPTIQSTNSRKPNQGISAYILHLTIIISVYDLQIN